MQPDPRAPEPRPGGKARIRTMREVYEGYAKSKRRPHPDWRPREFPAALWHTWDWWVDLAGARTGTGFDVNPVTFEAIRAWSEVTATRPTPAEVWLLRAYDDEWRRQSSQARQERDRLKRLREGAGE